MERVNMLFEQRVSEALPLKKVSGQPTQDTRKPALPLKKVSGQGGQTTPSHITPDKLPLKPKVIPENEGDESRKSLEYVYNKFKEFA